MNALADSWARRLHAGSLIYPRKIKDDIKTSTFAKQNIVNTSLEKHNKNILSNHFIVALLLSGGPLSLLRETSQCLEMLILC